MRDIKFRVWDSDWSRMVYPIGIDWETRGEHIVYYWCWDKKTKVKSGTPCHKKLCNIQQYTGIKDKNGKEIYEGDIVKIRTKFYDGQNEESIHDKTYTGQIVFTATKGFVLKNPSWHCHLSGANGRDNFYKSISLTRCEVIGNIHENPELLKS